MEDGSFQPQDTLTRAQTAKLISVFVRHGDSSNFSNISESVFTDVPKDHWAAGYISFGVVRGFLSGMGDGSFDPNGRVTVAQLATILDKLLGYVPEDVNREWPARAVTIAQSAGLLANIGKSAGEPLSREEAAQMMLNALMADKVSQMTNPGLNVTEFSYQTVKNSPEMDYLRRINNTTEQLIEALYPKITRAVQFTDQLGHQHTVWSDSENNAISELSETPAFVYSSRKTAEDIEEDLGAYSFDHAVLWLNGCAIPPSAGYIRDCADLADHLTDNGVPVEIYTDESDKVITRIIAVRYALKRIAKSDFENKTITVDTGNGTVAITEKEPFYSSISSAVSEDQVMAAPAYCVHNNPEGVSFETDWSALVDAYLPDLVNSAGINVRDPSDWIFVKSVYKDSDTGTGTSSWHVQGISETGAQLDLRLNNYGTSAAVSDSRMDAPRMNGQKTSSWLRKYQEMIENPDSQNNSDDPGAVIRGNSVFLRDGKAVCYKESAAGYFLSEEDKDSGGSTMSSSYVTKENLPGQNFYIGGIRVAETVRTINVGGTQADRLNVAITESVENIPAGATCIVKKLTTNSLRITAVFTEKESYQAETRNDLLRVTGTSGFTSYQDASGAIRNDGQVVTCYSTDSPDARTLIVSTPDMGTLRTGWYTSLTTNGEAFILDGYLPDATQVKWDSTTKSMTGGFYAGTIVSAADDSITVGGNLSSLTFQFSGDDAIRDLSGTGIYSIQTLIEAASSGSFNRKVVFSFTTKNGQNLITQLYIL